MRSATLAVGALAVALAGCGSDGTQGLGSDPHRFVVSQDGADLHKISEDEEAPTFKQSSRALSLSSHRAELAVSWTPPDQPGQAQRLGGFLDAPAYASFSPDGRTVLIGATRLAGDRRFYLFTSPATGGKLRKISDEVLTEAAAWSPDGAWIATANYNGDLVLYRPDGSEQRRVVHLSGGDSNTVRIENLAWSRDGSHIYFTAVKVPPET